MSNGISRTSSSLRNLFSGFLAQFIQIILGFISRTIFIKYLSTEYLGASSLFSNLLMMLSMAELGITSAFIYELYEPLSTKNSEKTAVILRYFKRTYYIIGIVIFVTGLILLPFLDQIIPQKPITITEDVRIIYLFYLIYTSSSYFFSYKISLLEADQKLSVATFNKIKFLILQNIFQILILVFTQSFLAYLGAQVISQILSNIYISRLVNEQYPFLSEYKNLKIEKSVSKNIIKNVKAAFLTKIGGGIGKWNR